MEIHNPTFPHPAEGAEDIPRVLLSDVIISNNSSVDLTLPSQFPFFQILIRDLIPATDATDLYLRISTDGGTTFAAGVADYGWGWYRTTTATPVMDEDASDAQINLAGLAALGSTGTEAFNAEILIFGANQNNVLFQAYAHISMHDSSATQSCLTGSGIYLTLAKVNSIRFIESSGNLESGRIQLWGIR